MNKKKKERITFAGIINSLILGLFTFICVYPLWYIFINSWSSPAAVNRGVYLIPREFSVEAYTNLLEIPGLTSSIGIAFARTILGTLLTLMCCSFAAREIMREIRRLRRNADGRERNIFKVRNIFDKRKNAIIWQNSES